MHQFKRYFSWIVFGMAFTFLVYLVCRFGLEAWVARTGGKALGLDQLDYNQLSEFYAGVFNPLLIISLFIGVLFGVWSAYRGLRFKTWEDKFLRKFSLMRGDCFWNRFVLWRFFHRFIVVVYSLGRLN